MASTAVHPRKTLKKIESKKSHSWWWDSHISPKNSKWLAENLEGMNENVTRMLKLLEEDGESFAKKAEMYYQKVPELVSLVGEFYRMYRALAERYDLAAGELKKDNRSIEQKLGRAKSGPRAAGFDVFLGNTFNKTEGSDSESNLDFSDKSGDQDLNLKIGELETELREANEKLRLREEDNVVDGSLRKVKTEELLDVEAKIASYELELKDANAKIKTSEEEITKLESEIKVLKSSEDKFRADPEKYDDKCGDQDLNLKIAELETELREANEKLRLRAEDDVVDGSPRKVKGEELSDVEAKIAIYELELKDAKAKIKISDEEITRLESEIKLLKSAEEKLRVDSEIHSDKTVALVEEHVITKEDNKTEALVEELLITKEKLLSAEKEIDYLKQQVETEDKVCDLQHQLEVAKEDIITWSKKLNAEKQEVVKLQEKIKITMLLSDKNTGSTLAALDAEAEISDLESKEQTAERKSDAWSLEDAIKNDTSVNTYVRWRYFTSVATVLLPVATVMMCYAPFRQRKA